MTGHVVDAESKIQAVPFGRVKAVIAEILCHPWLGRALGYVYSDRIPAHGLRIDTRFAVSERVKAMLFWGIYESAEVRFVDAYLRRGLDVIELGSSIGVVSCHIARLLGKHGRLICIEANPALCNVTTSNLTLNTPTANTKVINVAISYSDNGFNRVAFKVSDSSLLSSLATEPNDSNVLYIEATTLSKLLHKECIDDYALVSDIEGAELGIFLNDQDALQRCRQLIIELHRSTEKGIHYSVDDLLELLTNQYGYALVAGRGSVFVFEK